MSAPPVVLSIGVFDGVHRGHREVMRAAIQAGTGTAPVVAMTFDPHPAQVLGSADAPPLIQSVGERVTRLRDAGAQEVRVLRFDRALAALTPEVFLARYVHPFCRLQTLVVGYDFALGQGRSGDLPALQRLGSASGFRVLGVGPVELQGEPISSTRIRARLAEGDVAAAAALLGRPVTLTGQVGHGAGRGAGLGFPTANLELPSGLARPGSGVYAVHVHGAGVPAAPGVVNIGSRPTFGVGPVTVEAHLLDATPDLRGKWLTLEFVGKLRQEHKFNNTNDLVSQIQSDIAAARILLSTPGPADNPR